ncbi:hypothetical protein Hypma_009952 [Hypsizygus marmoreus]|uniref:Uncharacterized protein n=1 Tax=Hypsizygus marmoreus TaxID=39966 RepID=A0A369JLL4_HYPMA|nr:hypothetical protein Hypma_009952 [Hypsizygus marmoreus]
MTWMGNESKQVNGAKTPVRTQNGMPEAIGIGKKRRRCHQPQEIYYQKFKGTVSIQERKLLKKHGLPLNEQKYDSTGRRAQGSLILMFQNPM